MKKQCFFLLLIFSFAKIEFAIAQFDYLNLYAGTTFYPSDEKTNIAGVSESIFGGYKEGIKIGGSVEKYFTDNVGVTANIDYQIASKPRYSMSQLKLDLLLKYSFFRYNRLSPYFFAGANVSFFSIKQQSYNEEKEITPDYSGSDSSNLPVKTITQRYGEISVIFVPVLGFSGGGGLSFRVNEWFSIFGEYSANYYLNKQSSFPKSYFPINNTNLFNSTIQGGVKIDLY